MDSKSKCKLLEIINLNEENVTAWFLFLNCHQFVTYLRFFEKSSRDKSGDLLKNVKDDEFFICAKFWSISIICAEVI